MRDLGVADGEEFCGIWGIWLWGPSRNGHSCGLTPVDRRVAGERAWWEYRIGRRWVDSSVGKRRAITSREKRHIPFAPSGGVGLDWKGYLGTILGSGIWYGETSWSGGSEVGE